MSELREVVSKALRGWDGQAMTHDQLADHVTAVLVENAGGPEHIINVKGHAWTVQHPITERFDAETGGTSLFSCKFSQTADAVAHSIQLSEGDGKYRVWTEVTAILWERVK